MKKLLRLAVTALAAALSLAACEQEKVDALTVVSSEIKVTQFGGTQTVSFNTNSAWTASADKEWITLDAESGAAGDASIKITVAPSTEMEARTGTVTVLAGDVKTVFTVSQSYVEVFDAGSVIDVDANAQQVAINVTANVDYDVMVDEDAKGWISSPQATKAAAVSNVVTINVKANDGLVTREGKVYVKTDVTTLTYTIRQASAFVETTLGEAVYYGMAMKVYDPEEWVYLEDYDEYAVVLNTENGSVTLAFNAAVPEDAAVAEKAATTIPVGEFTIANDSNHTPGTLSVNDGSESVYTCIVADGKEYQVAEGSVTITKDEQGVYSIVAFFIDENSNTKNFSFVGKIENIADKSTAAVIQDLNYLGNYSTWFAKKAVKYYLTTTVSKALKAGDPYPAYVTIEFYCPASSDATALPAGKYTLCPGNDPATIESGYPNGNVDADPWTCTISGNTKDQNTHFDAKDGSTVTVSVVDGKYVLDFDAELVSYTYDDDWNPVYGDAFAYKGTVPAVNAIAVTDNSMAVALDEDFEFTGNVSVNPAYAGFWFGDSYALGGNVFYFGWSTGVDDNYSVMFTLHTASSYTFEKNFNNRYCSTPVPEGTYTFVKEKPAENGNFICNLATTSKTSVTNTYTGSKAYIQSGSITISSDEITVDMICKIAAGPNAGKDIKYTGKLPATCYYFRDYSAAKYQTNVAWAKTSE